MKCSECNNCNIIVDERRNAQVRCALKHPPKNGKILMYAMTVYKSKEDILIGNAYEFGDDRVRASLNKKVAPPTWCPLKQ